MIDKLKVTSFEFSNLQAKPYSASLSWRKLYNLRKLSKSINEYPYFAIIKGASDLDLGPKGSDLYQLVSQLNKMNGTQNEKLSVTRVTIDNSVVKVNDGVTRHSRQPGALNLHTDSSYMDNPHAILAFQCIVADPKGGETLLMPIDDIVNNISEHSKQLLSAKVFPFSNDPSPILSMDEEGKWNVRFYKTQLEKNIKNSLLDKKYLAAIDELEVSIANKQNHFRTKLKPGEIILVNNLKALHGRSNIDENSPRVIYRVRSSTSLYNLMVQSNWKIIIFWLNQFVKQDKQTPTLLAPQKPQTINQLAMAGKLNEAIDAYDLLPEKSKEDAELQFLISGVARYLGDNKRADSTLKKAIMLQPVVCNHKLDEQYPSFMKLRGFNGAEWTIKKKGNLRLRGGHFSLKFMLDSEKASLYQGNIYDICQTEADAQEIKKMGISLIINTIACADRMAVDLAVLIKLQQYLPEIPVINSPDKVLLTTREKNYQRLSAIPNVVFPKTIKTFLASQIPAQIVTTMSAESIVFPVIMRPCITHTGVGVELLDNINQLQLYLDAHRNSTTAYYIIQYHQLAMTEGVFNKIRTFCIDGKYYPVACYLINNGIFIQVIDIAIWQTVRSHNKKNKPTWLIWMNFWEIKR